MRSGVIAKSSAQKDIHTDVLVTFVVWGPVPRVSACTGTCMHAYMHPASTTLLGKQGRTLTAALTAYPASVVVLMLLRYF